MMLPPYRPPYKDDSFFTLLRLARISQQASSPDRDARSEALSAFSRLPAYLQELRGVLPLIHSNAIETSLIDSLPEAVSGQLKQSAVKAMAGNLVNDRWLQRILALLEKERIPVILLKSAAFSDNLYSASAPRVGRDLDILVTRERFEDACEALKGIMQPIFVNKNRPVTHATLFERVFRPIEEIGPTVEIHRELTNPGIFEIEEESLWNASTPHPRYVNQNVRLLSPEYTLLHLAVHAFRDLDFCTHNLVDAHEVICQWRPDFQLLTKRAAKWGARNALHCLLENCSAVLETPIPDSCLDSLRPSKSRSKLMHWILQSTQLQITPHKKLGYRVLQLLGQLTFPDNVRRGLVFQGNYAITRLKDTIAMMKNGPSRLA